MLLALKNSHYLRGEKLKIHEELLILHLEA
jgi:hypothetical protein